VVGCVGEVILATRGADGPGEVLVKVRGGRETFFAYSEQPLPRGTVVLVFDTRADRSVDVMEWHPDPLDDERVP
jgi:hypothetical protein